jgi:hypothetical protein
MSQESAEAGRVADDRLRLDLYELYHERAERTRRWQFLRLGAGHLVVGTILAYAFVFDGWRFVALTPVLYGIVVMDALKYSVRLLYLERQLVALEAKLQRREPLFDWATEFGFFGEGDAVEVGGVDLTVIPETTQYVLILSIYVVLVAGSLVAWQPLDSATPGVTVELLAGSYAVFSLLFATIIAVGYAHYQRVSGEIESLRGDTEES